MAEAAAGATIPSATKERSPPDAISCCLVDHANGRALQGIFQAVVSSKNDAMVEKVVHTIYMHCRLHNQTLCEALLPLMGKLKKGSELSEAMQAKVEEVEGLMEAVDKSKKHLDNKEFMEAAQKHRMAETELWAMTEQDVLPAMMEELDMDELVKAAEQMEAVKNKAPLMPQLKATA